MTKTDFRALQKEWYAKAKASGFRDLEKGDTFASQGWFAGRFQFEYTAAPVRWRNKEEYFRQCGVFLHQHKFSTPLERRMWELHTEGEPDEEIAAILGRGLTRKKVWHRLTILEARMLQGQSKARKGRETLAKLYTLLKWAERVVRGLRSEIAATRQLIKENDW